MRFAALACGVVAVTSAVTAGLLAWQPDAGVVFGVPTWFFITTVLLVLGSVVLHRAIIAVRREKQPLFRRWLLVGVGVGGLFTALQTLGLTTLVPDEGLRSQALAQQGAVPFAIALIAMHALHVVASQLVLAWIVVQAFNDRYDHEFYKPVTFCVGFWDVLGLAWLSFLAMLVITL